MKGRNGEGSDLHEIVPPPATSPGRAVHSWDSHRTPSPDNAHPVGALLTRSLCTTNKSRCTLITTHPTGSAPAGRHARRGDVGARDAPLATARCANAPGKRVLVARAPCALRRVLRTLGVVREPLAVDAPSHARGNIPTMHLEHATPLHFSQFASHRRTAPCSEVERVPAVHAAAVGLHVARLYPTMSAQTGRDSARATWGMRRPPKPATATTTATCSRPARSVPPPRRDTHSRGRSVRQAAVVSATTTRVQARPDDLCGLPATRRGRRVRPDARRRRGKGFQNTKLN